ncbi:MAG: hypothetical protein Q4C87_11630 [Actinomycetaceae bacterium]|nr:hypothetical protein [Actinomycetaceae bacterium]
MTPSGYVDRNRLKSWADERASQSEFPRLVRRLLLETTPGLVELGMPAGDGVAAGGWDGTVRASQATAWVPEGLSVWELSVNASPNKKADDDYGKRNETPDGSATSDCTYVEAVLRPWKDREKWAAEKRNEEFWRDVRALGLDDIETWLEAAPVTWAWLSEELGLTPRGLRTGEKWWQDWATQTDPEITPGIVLAGRSEVAKLLEQRLAIPGTTTTISGASLEELRAFIAAAAVDRDERGEGQTLARLAFVDELSSWRQLIASDQPLILVPTKPELVREIRRGTKHSYCVPVLAEANADLIVPALDTRELATALQDAGVTDDEKVEELSRLGRRGLPLLWQHIALKPELYPPAWADKPVLRDYRSILLAGSWNETAQGDRSTIEELAGRDYESFRGVAAEVLDSASDPLAIRTGDTWHLASPVTAWKLLVSTLTHDDLQRFESVAKKVLMEIDPAAELPRDQQWAAPIYGKDRSYSADLRKGLAQSLALLGTYGNAIVVYGEMTGADFANYLVGNLMTWAMDDSSTHAWQSLDEVLPLLAEAGPEAFLQAVTALVKGNNPQAKTLFEDGEDQFSVFFNSSLHVNLLWALECLSWCSDYFGQVVDLLARLDEIDPGGRMSNRPAELLAAFFRPWYPESPVGPDRRIAVLDNLRRRHPDTAWKVESSMLPEGNATALPIAGPKFRAWKPDRQPVTYGECWKVTSAAVVRCIEDARTDPERWVVLLKHISEMLPSDRQKVIDALAELASQSLSETTFRGTIWNQLVEFICRHRESPNAPDALSGEELGNLEVLAQQYQPDAAYQRRIHLFQSWTPCIGIPWWEQHKAYMCELGRQRAEAIREIEAEGGIDAIKRLAREATVGGAVGLALAVLGSRYDAELLGWLTVETEHVLTETAFSYFSSRYAQEGFEFIAELVACEGLTVVQRARLLLVVCEHLPEVWRMLDEDEELHARYWAEFCPFARGGDIDKVEEVAEQLIRVGRYEVALRFLGIYSRPAKCEPYRARARLIVQALSRLIEMQPSSASEGSLRTHDFQNLFEYLETARKYLEPGELAQLEWSYLPVLGTNPKVPALSEYLAIAPEIFVDLVCAVYRPQSQFENGENSAQQNEEQRDGSRVFINAYRLLQAWDIPPGLVDGVMNMDLLRTWLDKTRELLAERRRTENGLKHFGQVLGHTPSDSDGTWPGAVVRDLLEDEQDEHIETGLYRYIVNNRGVTIRALEEGGGQEEKLVAHYRTQSKVLADIAPRTAALFRHVVASYEREARYEEDNAEGYRRGVY